MNKRYMLYFSAILLAFLIIMPGIAAAGDNAYTNVTASTARQMLKDGEVCLLDVRTHGEFDAAHLKDAKLIPIKLVLGPSEPYVSEKEFLNEVKKCGIKKDEPILVYCLSGARSTKASEYLANNGYTVYNMKVGIQVWIDAGYPVVSTFVDVSDVNCHIKPVLETQIDCVFFLLENGCDQEAREQLDEFNFFVDEMKEINLINSDQATYLKAEAEFIRKMII